MPVGAFYGNSRIIMFNVHRYKVFNEFDKKILYDTEGLTACVINDIEEVIINNLPVTDFNLIQKALNCNLADIKIAIKSLKKKGILNKYPHVPFQDPSQSYTLFINLTEDCNLRCKYCYIKHNRSSTYMTEEIGKQAIDFILQFENLNNLGISFYGGEPLLNFPVMKSILQYSAKEIRKRGLPEVEFHLTTNAMLLTKEITSCLRDYNVHLSISMDSPIDMHSSFRITKKGADAHSIVLKNLEKTLNEKKIQKVSLSSVITNKGRLRNSFDYLKKFEIHDLKISHVRYSEKDQYGLSASNINDYKKDLSYIALENLNIILKGKRPPYYGFENNILQLYKQIRRKYFCPASINRFGISPSGDIYPCGPSAAMREWKIGKLSDGLDQNLINKWLGYSSIIERGECKECWARLICLGGCPINTVRVDKELCEINRHVVMLSIAIYASIMEENELMLGVLVDDIFISELFSKLEMVKKQTC